MNELIITIGIFFFLQFVNVMLNTAKSLIMARTDNPHWSALINAITFGFYTMVVKQIATLDLSITIVVVILTNVIGVYATYAIVNKLKKDNLWKIEIFSRSDIPFIHKALKENKIPCTMITPEILTVYAYTQEDSTAIKNLLQGRKVKYNITEITKKF